MDIINVDEARSLSGFNSLTGSRIAKLASIAIKQSADEDKKTGTTVELQRYKLQKYSIKEAREILEDNGFRVDVSKDNGLVKLNISWFFPTDRDMELVF